MSHDKHSPARRSPAPTLDDLLDRNRALIDLAQAAVDEQHRLRRMNAERAGRTRARTAHMREHSGALAVRLKDIQAATKERCRKSRRASERSPALMGPPLPPEDQ